VIRNFRPHSPSVQHPQVDFIRRLIAVFTPDAPKMSAEIVANEIGEPRPRGPISR